MAIVGSRDSGFDAVEFDLVITSDLVPVLSHDPWVDPVLCTTAGGAPVDEEILIQDLSYAELTEGWLCGGGRDPAYPQAQVNAEPMMSFDEVIAVLKGVEPHLWVHIDLKWEPETTPEPEVFAEAVLERWFEADLPNPYYVSANSEEAIRAVEAYGRDANRDVTTSLVWPRFAPGVSTVAVALKAERDIMLGLTDYVSLAQGADADGLAVYYEVADRRQLEIARAEGLQTQLWTLNDGSLLGHYARWPVDALITDYPGDYP